MSDLKKVLMIAYTFPPFSSVGGSIRIAKFIKYLPTMGWLPTVLTIDDRQEYDTQQKQGSEELLKEIPESVKIFRTGAGEPTKEILEKGRAARRKNVLLAVLITFLSRARTWAIKYVLLPDQRITWLPFALRLGRRVVKQEGIDVIFATCPAHSVAIIGTLLKLLTGKRLVIDFRDDWIDTPWYHSKPWFARKIEPLMEKWVVKTADRVVLVTEWSRNEFTKRYPEESQEKFVYISNGCDLKDFRFLESEGESQHSQESKFTIVHAGRFGLAENWKRSPEPFFQALCQIKMENSRLAANLVVAFTGYLPEPYRKMVYSMGLSEIVKELGYLPKPEFIRFMKRANLLLVINYEGWSTLVPGKIYEYWAVGGPPILLVSCPGAAQSLVDQKHLGLTVPDNDVNAIKDAIWSTYQKRENGEILKINRNGIEEFDRQALSMKLAQLLNLLVSH